MIKFMFFKLKYIFGLVVWELELRLFGKKILSPSAKVFSLSGGPEFHLRDHGGHYQLSLTIDFCYLPNL